MDLYEALSRRRMTRRFDPRPVEEDQLDRVLSALAHLPSAGFSQGVDTLVLTSPTSRGRFWDAASQPAWRAGASQAAGLLAAPVVLLPLADPAAYLSRYGEPDKARSGLAGLGEDAWDVPYWLVDTAFAVLALLLAAEAEGLGALFFRLHGSQEEVLAACGAPAGRQAVGALALGYRAPDDRPSGSPARRRRRPLEELVHREAWSPARDDQVEADGGPG